MKTLWQKGRKGGTIIAIRQLTIWLILLSVAIICIVVKEKRQNYRKLWQKVSELEARIDVCP